MSEKPDTKEAQICGFTTAAFDDVVRMGELANFDRDEVRRGIIYAALTDLVYVWYQSTGGDRALMDAGYAVVEQNLRNSYGVLADSIAAAMARAAAAETRQ